MMSPIFAVLLYLFACLLREGDADCSTMRCGYYSNCEYINGTAMCVCDMKCGTWMAPICGSDDVTYGNECLMNMQSCLLKQMIYTKHIGICSSEDRNCSSLPPPPKNSKYVEVSNGTFYVHCSHGYYRKGDARVKCRNGQWEIFAACHKKACSHPEPLENGKADYELSNFGSKVSYKCGECFYLDGPKERVCLGNETWSGKKPVCKPIDCGHLLDDWKIPNGIAFGDNTYCGSTIEFECFKGYDLVGSQKISCQVNGRWSAKKPACLLHTDSSTPALLHKRPLSQCMPLDSPRNGQIKNTNLFRFYLPGQRLTFECKDHYELTGEAILTCMENGNWSHPPPSCIRSKPDRIIAGASTECPYCYDPQYICKRIQSSNFTIIGKLIDESVSSYTLRITDVVKDVKDLAVLNENAEILKKHTLSKCTCIPKGAKGKLIFTGFYVTSRNNVSTVSRVEDYVGKFYGTKKIRFCVD